MTHAEVLRDGAAQEDEAYIFFLEEKCATAAEACATFKAALLAGAEALERIEQAIDKNAPLDLIWITRAEAARFQRVNELELRVKELEAERDLLAAEVRRCHAVMDNIHKGNSFFYAKPSAEVAALLAERRKG